MAFEPHLRLSLLGTLPNQEIFSCNLSLRPDNSDWSAAVGQVQRLSVLGAYLGDPNAAWFDDLVADCQSYWASSSTRISADAVLRRVKVASIGADGKYTGTPKEAAVTTPGAVAAGVAPIFPYQVAKKVTLETNGDIGRIKGGFFLPGVTAQEYDYTIAMHSAAATETIRDRTRQFIDDLNNAPGLDGRALKVVIASQGRRNPDGSLRVPPGNHDVVSVNVGRRVDTQRRRLNGIGEARIVDALVS